MNIKRVLYISYDGLTDPLGESQILPYILGLSEYGYEFVILSCEKKSSYLDGKNRILDTIKDSKVKWYPLLYTKTPPILSTVYDYWKLKIKAIMLQKKYDFSLVHCRSYIPSMIGMYLKEKFKVKFLFDMRGFWADERVDGGLWNRKKYLFNEVYLFFKKQEKKFIENADHIISLTQAGADEIRSWAYVDRSSLSISVIPCCVDTCLFNKDNISASDVGEKRDELGFRKNDKIISYLGSIGTWYLLDEMLAFFKSYLKKVPKAKFLFITKDSHELIKAKCINVGIDLKDIAVVSSSRSLVPLYLSLSSFSIFFIKPTYSKKSSSPTKQGELMSMGVPVICNAGVGDTDWIVNRYNSGFVVNEFEEDSYNDVVDKMSAIQFDKRELRNGAIDFFSLDKGIKSYSKIYNGVL